MNSTIAVAFSNRGGVRGNRVDMFLEGPGAKARDAIHLIFAGEKVRPEYDFPAPAPSDAVRLPGSLRVLRLEDLIRMKLTSFRRKDQVHLQDLIGVELLGECILPSLPPPLADRLKTLLDDPEG